jgi:hypothetical protein
VGHTSDTEINLYQYEYALEMQARQARSPSKASEIANSAKRNDIKTIDEINGILAQIKADEAIGFCDLSSQIKEAVKNLAQTISKISEEKSFGVFLNLTANLGKIEGVLHKHIPNGAEIPNKNDDSPRSDDQAIFVETDREKLYARLIQIKQELMAADRHSPSHCLLELIVSWQNKTLLDIINDLKEGNTPAHQLLRILMS